MSNAPPKEPNRPIDELKDGRLKSKIWRNEGEERTTYNVVFSYLYKNDEGEWAESRSIPSNELLRQAHLSERTYDRVGELKREEFRKSREQPRTRERRNRDHPRER